MQNLARWVIIALRTVVTVKISNFKKINIADGRHREQLRIGHIYATVWPMARNLACWCTLALRTLMAFKISNFYKIKMADDRHLQKSKNGHISISRVHNGLTDRREIWHCDRYLLWEPYRQLKILIPKNPRWRTAAILITFKLLYLSTGSTWCRQTS